MKKGRIAYKKNHLKGRNLKLRGRIALMAQEVMKMASNVELVKKFVGIGVALAPREIFKEMAEIMRRFQNSFERDGPVQGVSFDCRKGCTWCCFLNVDLLPYEAITLRDWLKVNKTRAELEKILEKAKEKEERTGSLTHDQKLVIRHACPLLEGVGICGAYEARPMNCRKVYSADVEMCKHGFLHPEDRKAPNAWWKEAFECGTDIEAGLTIAYYQRYGEVNDRTMEGWLVKMLPPVIKRLPKSDGQVSK